MDFQKELLKVERIPCHLELRLETQTTVEVWSTIIGDLTGGLLDHCWMDYWFPELTNKNLKKSRFEVWLTIGGFCQQKILNPIIQPPSTLHCLVRRWNIYECLIHC